MNVSDGNEIDNTFKFLQKNIYTIRLISAGFHTFNLFEKMIYIEVGGVYASKF
jgi:hypothetical protein